MKKVYIVNKGGHNYSPATEFGELVFCTEGLLDPFNVASMYRILSDSMKDSKPGDYILLTSLTVLCSVACAVFARKHGRLNLLLFRNGRYVERQLEIDSLLSEISIPEEFNAAD